MIISEITTRAYGKSGAAQSLKFRCTSGPRKGQVRAISSLEQRIGSQLFIRNARGVSLSVEGEAWLPYVSAAFRSLEESYEDI